MKSLLAKCQVEYIPLKKNLCNHGLSSFNIKNNYEDPRKDVLMFGKNKGKTIEQLMKDDPAYLKWMMKECSYCEQRYADLENDDCPPGANCDTLDSTPDCNDCKKFYGNDENEVVVS